VVDRGALAVKVAAHASGGGSLDSADRLRALDSLHALSQLDPGDRLDGLVALAARENVDRAGVIAALLEVVESGEGTSRQRLAVGAALGKLGDPRLRRPDQADYWVEIDSDLGPIRVGKHLVTNAEFAAWVAAGGYRDTAAWTDEGRAWLAQMSDPWPSHSDDPAFADFTVPNQPVVGVTLHEALAYATASNATLPRSDERVRVVRGREKRPYPWGSPFGEGNANTREEVLGRPCAVGLYVRDRTPEGVTDLAGNAAEWMADDVGGQRLVHPGAWDQPSMAAWAKALALHAADARWAGLGFRLAREVA
jgi:hypothetical protein